MPRYLGKKFLNFVFLYCFLSVSFCSVLNAQNNNNEPYQLFDNIIGQTNAGIFNGLQYYDKFQVKGDKHQFFKHKFFIYGSLVYKGEPYFDMSIKYDLHTDELLVKNLEVTNGSITVLNKQYIDQFELNGHQFRKLEINVNEYKRITGFFEVLLEHQSISVLKKHTKKMSRIVDGEVSYEFKEQYAYYLRFNENYYQLKKTNSLVSIFPEYKVPLRNSFKQYSNLRKTDPDTYLLSIITDLNKLIKN